MPNFLPCEATMRRKIAPIGETFGRNRKSERVRVFAQRDFESRNERSVILMQLIPKQSATLNVEKKKEYITTLEDLAVRLHGHHFLFNSIHLI